MLPRQDHPRGRRTTGDTPDAGQGTTGYPAPPLGGPDYPVPLPGSGPPLAAGRGAHLADADRWRGSAGDVDTDPGPAGRPPRRQTSPGVRHAEIGMRSPGVRPAATGRSIQVTASSAACSSTRPRGRSTAAPPTLHGLTSASKDQQDTVRRLRWPPGCLQFVVAGQLGGAPGLVRWWRQRWRRGLNLSTIPIAAQKYANDCIDASARIILSHSGINMSEDQLKSVIAPGGTIGSQAAGLNQLNPAGGYVAMAGSGGSQQAMFAAIKASIDNGTGSILNVAPGNSIAGKSFSEGHFIAATGYNADGTITCLIPRVAPSTPCPPTTLSRQPGGGGSSRAR